MSSSSPPSVVVEWSADADDRRPSRAEGERALLRRCGVDDRRDARDPVGRKATELRVTHDQRFVRRVVDAVDLVGGHVAVDPLHAGSKACEDAAGFLRDLLEFRRAQLAGTGYVPLDHELRHVTLPTMVIGWRRW